jgi:hypothetical protein
VLRSSCSSRDGGRNGLRLTGVCGDANEVAEVDVVVVLKLFD